LCYLALFVRYDDLRKRNNFEELRIFLKQYYNAGSPNMKVVERVFIENQEFIDMLKERAAEEERRKRKEREEQERLA
jgi:hypothetical protein